MTARDKFQVGDRVQLTQEARKTVRCFDGGRGTKGTRVYTGVVEGFCASPLFVRIKPDRARKYKPYHMDDWEKAKNG